MAGVPPMTQDTTTVEARAREAIAYGNWLIDFNPPPIPTRHCDWQFWHKDYDGPEDTRCGHGASLIDCMNQIDDLEDDRFECLDCRMADPSSCMKAGGCEWRDDQKARLTARAAVQKDCPCGRSVAYDGCAPRETIICECGRGHVVPDAAKQKIPKRAVSARELLAREYERDGDALSEAVAADIRAGIESSHAARIALRAISTALSQRDGEGVSRNAGLGWQPIETAPKDGGWLLLGRFTGKGKNHDGLVERDRWHDRAKDDSYDGWGQFNQQLWPATHWQPLPAPPLITNDGGAE